MGGIGLAPLPRRRIGGLASHRVSFSLHGTVGIIGERFAGSERLLRTGVVIAAALTELLAKRHNNIEVAGIHQIWASALDAVSFIRCCVWSEKTTQQHPAPRYSNEEQHAENRPAPRHLLRTRWFEIENDAVNAPALARWRRAVFEDVTHV